MQEDFDMDILVRGGPEENEMVEYFGEQLQGFAFTVNVWVQSYGSRCVKPQIIYRGVSRPKPMTVFWSKCAAKTDHQVQGRTCCGYWVIWYCFPGHTLETGDPAILLNPVMLRGDSDSLPELQTQI